MLYNLPNILTISRIVVIPVIFLAIYIHSVWWSILAGVLFVMASVTDYLDGYFARLRNRPDCRQIAGSVGFVDFGG